MGVNPDIAKREKLQRELDAWHGRFKHRRCGTIVEIDKNDVKAFNGLVGAGAVWRCPCCDMNVKISTWKLKERLVWFMLGFV